MEPATPVDEASLLRFVEQFALVLTDSGMQRMPARVFAYVLAHDGEQYTAAQLADGLQVSPAAISGAVRILVQAGLLVRERDPGSRADHYRVYDDDIWAHIMLQRMTILTRYEEILGAAIEQLDRGRENRRLTETLDYMAFMLGEMPRTVEAWRKVRAERYGDSGRSVELTPRRGSPPAQADQ